MQLGTQRKFEVLSVYPVSHSVPGPTRHWFTNGFSLLLHPPPLSPSPSTQPTHPKTCKLWCQKQFSPLSTSSTFFFHSTSPPPFPPVLGDPRTTPRTSSKSGDGLEDTINRIKPPSLSTNHPPILPSIRRFIQPWMVESRINKEWGTAVPLVSWSNIPPSVLPSLSASASFDATTSKVYVK